MPELSTTTKNPIISKRYGRKPDITPNKILNTIRKESIPGDPSSMKIIVAWNNAKGERQESNIVYHLVNGKIEVKT